MTIDEAEKIKAVVGNKNYIAKLVNTVAKTILESFENLTIEDVDMYKLGYNKAIDEFSERLKQKNKVFDISNRIIDELAEQLKAGGENDRL